MTNILTRQEVIAILRVRLKRAGTLKLLGADLDGKNPLSPTYLNDVIRGRKRPGKRILKPLGLERKTTEVYRRVSGSEKG